MPRDRVPVTAATATPPLAHDLDPSGARAGATDPPADAVAQRERARWLIGLRWVACVVGAAALLLVSLVHDDAGYAAAAGPLLACLAVLAAANAAFTAALHTRRSGGRDLTVQMAGDLLLLTVMLHFAGSIDTSFVGLYALHLILANILLERRAALGLTALAVVLVIGLTVAEATGLIMHRPTAGPHLVTGLAGPIGHARVEWLTWLAGVLVTLAGTAYLAAAAAGRLRNKQRQLDQALRTAAGERTKLERVLDAAGAGLRLIDDDGRIVWASAGGAASMHRHADTARCGRCAPCAARRALDERRTVAAEFSEVDGAGIRRFFRATASPLHAVDRELGRVVEVIQDITESKAMEREVVRTGKLAATGRLAAVVAHEIGNPLASLRARLSLMERSHDPAFARKSAVILSTQIERIERIVRGLSRFARPRGPSTARCDLAGIAREVVDFVRLEPRAKHVTIAVSAAPGIPPVSAVRDELSQVLLNLVLNAIQAAGPSGHIRIDVARDGDHVTAAVTDDGPGAVAGHRRQAVRAVLLHP